MAGVLDDPWIAEALRRFSSSYEDKIGNRRLDILGKAKSVYKFGRNTDMTSGELATIWDVGPANETYLDAGSGTSSNLIDRVSSSNASDAQGLRVEGHYLSAANTFHFVALRATLNGQTPVDLANATVLSDLKGEWSSYNKLARVSRMANLGDTADLAGDVYCYQNGQTVTSGVPQDLTLTHAKIRGTDGLNQTNKCATTISNEDFGILTACRAGVARSVAAFVDYTIEIAERPNIFRERALGISSRDSGFTPIFSEPPFIVLPPNTDIRVRGTASTNSVGGLATLNILLGRLV